MSLLCALPLFYLNVCWIGHDGNTQGEKNNFLRRKTRHTVGAHMALVEQLRLSVSTLNMLIRNSHVIEVNANQYGHSQAKKKSKQSKISDYFLKK
jgi:hypothetical protein